MSLTINIDGITVFAKHGVYDEEKNNNQKFLIDLNVELKEETINLTNYELDSLDETINYETFVNEVIAICKNNSFNLLETLKTLSMSFSLEPNGHSAERPFDRMAERSFDHFAGQPKSRSAEWLFVHTV